jgi:hypothetical protein
MTKIAEDEQREAEAANNKQTSSQTHGESEAATNEDEDNYDDFVS